MCVCVCVLVFVQVFQPSACHVVYINFVGWLCVEFTQFVYEPALSIHLSMSTITLFLAGQLCRADMGMFVGQLCRAALKKLACNQCVIVRENCAGLLPFAQIHSSYFHPNFNICPKTHEANSEQQYESNAHDDIRSECQAS